MSQVLVVDAPSAHGDALDTLLIDNGYRVTRADSLSAARAMDLSAFALVLFLC